MMLSEKQVVISDKKPLPLKMRKGMRVVEIGDDSHVGVYILTRRHHYCLVRWAPNCARWHSRRTLRLAAQ